MGLTQFDQAFYLFSSYNYGVFLQLTYEFGVWCSYVLASYAHFLWETEEEDEEDSRYETATANTHGFSPSFFPGGPFHSPLAAAS